MVEDWKRLISPELISLPKSKNSPFLVQRFNASRLKYLHDDFNIVITGKIFRIISPHRRVSSVLLYCGIQACSDFVATVSGQRILTILALANYSHLPLNALKLMRIRKTFVPLVTEAVDAILLKSIRSVSRAFETTNQQTLI
jgi:hypothetical protein